MRPPRRGRAASDFARQIMDTKVQPKAVMFPTAGDPDLCRDGADEPARERLVRLAQEFGAPAWRGRHRIWWSDFAVEAPNRLWMVDITYIPTLAGLLYLAVALNASSRRIVSWVMTGHLRTQLVLDALEMALGQRRPEEVCHHSDQGSQYTSIAFGARCRQANAPLHGIGRRLL